MFDDETIYALLFAPLLSKLPTPRLDIDWDKWGKFRTIEIEIACGLLARFDYQAYQKRIAYLDEKIISGHEYYRLKGSWANEQRQLLDYASDWVDKKNDIMKVVRSHIAGDHFVRVVLKEMSHKEALKRNQYLSISNEKFYCEGFVDLPEFGTWAKATGYELPPEFPISLVNKGLRKISSREMPKALDILECLKSLNDDYKDIDESNIPEEMQRLIIQYYGTQPTKTQLLKDLSLKGFKISRPTLTKFFDFAFDDVKL